MANHGQSPQEALSAMWQFVSNDMTIASENNSGGTLNKTGLDALGDAHQRFCKTDEKRKATKFGDEGLLLGRLTNRLQRQNRLLFHMTYISPGLFDKKSSRQSIQSMIYGDGNTHCSSTSQTRKSELGSTGPHSSGHCYRVRNRSATSGIDEADLRNFGGVAPLVRAQQEPLLHPGVAVGRVGYVCG